MFDQNPINQKIEFPSSKRYNIGTEIKRIKSLNVMPELETYVVGRKEEVDLLTQVIDSTQPQIINFFGISGIGKSVVCNKYEKWCSENEIIFTTLRAQQLTVFSIDRILHHFAKDLTEYLPIESGNIPFKEYFVKFEKYKSIEKVVEWSDGIGKMFDTSGNILNNDPISNTELPKEQIRKIEKYFSNRVILESFMNEKNASLTTSFIKGVEEFVNLIDTKFVLQIDTYEMMEGIDEWMCNDLVKYLLEYADIMLFGRDNISKRNQDWIHHYSSNVLRYHEIQELDRHEAEKFLRHHGLKDNALIERVYKFTKGYPLCLVLSVALANELGGWTQVDNFDNLAYRDQIAKQLLERILQQQGVYEIRTFLEKGVVTEWFDPRFISFILGTSLEEGRKIYDKISKFSFVSRHPRGLQFHERVREILECRYTHTYGEKAYRQLLLKCRDYALRQSGIDSNQS